MAKLKLSVAPPRGEEQQFSDFLLREASRSTFNQEENTWSIPFHSVQDVFWLGADWHLYKSQGYTFTPVGKPNPEAKQMRLIAVGMRRTANQALDLWDDGKTRLDEDEQQQVHQLLTKISETSVPVLPAALVKEEGAQVNG